MVTLKHVLRRRGTRLTSAQALAQLATLHRADIVLPTTDGREIRLRRVTQPTPQQQRLLDQLKIPIPSRWPSGCPLHRRRRDRSCTRIRVGWRPKREIGRLPVTDMLLAAVSADGSRIATTDRDGTSVRVWDTDNLELLLILSDDDQHGGGIAFTPDGRLIAGRSSGGLTIWETRKPFCAACPPGVTRR